MTSHDHDHSHTHEHTHTSSHSLSYTNTISESVTTTSRTPHTAHGEAQRQALVDAAYYQIAEGGFEGLRTRDVAARAGVNIATLHYYFATKEDLIRAVLERLYEEVSTVHAPPYETETKTPLEELRSEFADMVYQLRLKPETYVVFFELGLRSLRDPSIRGMLRDLTMHWREHIEGYLKEGVRQGLFRPDLDVPAAAAGLIALLEGALIQMMSEQGNFPEERVYAEVEQWITGCTDSARAEA